MGRIYLIMGKSASGKDSIYHRLVENMADDFRTIVTYTTRPMREGETEGKEYHFVDQDRLNDFRGENRVIEERIYETVYGPWTYFTADDGQIELEKYNYLSIGTLESFLAMKNYFGEEAVYPIYIEVDDGIRLSRALNREMAEEVPKYEELCRRFLADQKDFSEERLLAAGITRRFENKDLEETIEVVRKEIYGYTSK